MIWLLNKISVQDVARNLISRNQSHYEVLNLPKNCTPKQIKDAYIKLSKKHHPDRNANAKSHLKFIRIVDAYNVLSKTDLRRDYDLGLVPNITNYPASTNSNFKNPWQDSSFWHNRNKDDDKHYEQKPYYGIKGVQKVSNFMIVLMCCFITSVGIALQALAINNSFTFNRVEMLKKSHQAEQALMETRRKAMENGNLMQLKIMKEKMSKSTDR